MIEISKEADFAFIPSLEVLVPNNATPPHKRVPSIYYLFHFRKDFFKIQALIDFGIEINVMTLAYAKKLEI